MHSKKITSDELRINYPDLHSVQFDTLYNTTSAILLDLFGTIGPYSEYWWQHLIFEAWLRENKIDLAAQLEWHFRDYTLDLTPVDLSGNRQPELIGELRKGSRDYPDYQEFMVLQRDETAPGKYRQIKTPPLWYDNGCIVHARCGGGAQTFKIADVNGDGLPEWLVATHDCGYGECGGSLLVLGWRHGEMVDLANASGPSLAWTGPAPPAPPHLPPDGTWAFQPGGNGNHLIVQSYQFHDNRDCVVTYSNTFTWNKRSDHFAAGPVATTYENSAACALRKGQAAISNSDYLSAVDDYERALALFPTNGDDYTREARQYAQIRLMLAYALAREPTQALALRDQLKTQTAESTPMSYLLDALNMYGGDNDRMRFCAAEYEAVGKYQPFFSNDKTFFWTFGQTDDVKDRPMNYVGGDFSPDISGCDVQYLFTNMLQPSLTSSKSIPDRLIKAGIKPSIQFSTDLNNDRVPDWLFWLDGIPDLAFVVLSSGKSYTLGLSNIPMPDEQTQLIPVLLGGGSEPTLIAIRFGNLSIWDAYNLQPCGKNRPFGELNLWRAAKNDLQSNGYYLLCQPRTLAQLFPSPTKLQAWYTANDVQTAAETVFTWNSADQTYEPPALPTIRQTNQTCDDQLYSYCGFQVTGAAAMAMFNSTLASPPPKATPSFLAAVRYKRALLLSRYGNTAAALVDFKILYQNGPTTSWKALAALHLEQANGGPLP